MTGINDHGTISVDGSERSLATSDLSTTGPVLITINPNAIALHTSAPGGSPRNSWQATVATVESSGDITRVTLAGPLSLNVDITPGAAAALELEPGSSVWASIKATEVFVSPS